MAAQEQAKVSQESFVSQQSVKEPLDADVMPVDEDAAGTANVVPTTPDILECLSNRRNMILPRALDRGSSRLYIILVGEPCLMPNVGWER